VKKGAGTINKVLLGAMLLIAATSAAASQTYPYYGPYGYGAYGPAYFAPGIYNYVGEPNVAPPIGYGADVYGTARNWQYYRSSGPAEALTRSRPDECCEDHPGLDAAGGRGDGKLSHADAKLGAEPTKLRAEFARRRRYLRRAV
jgi:hypothetical protein